MSFFKKLRLKGIVWGILEVSVKVFEKVALHLYLYRKKHQFKKVGDGVIIGKNVEVNCNNVMVGDNVLIYPNVIFWGSGQIIVEDNVSIGHGSIIYANQEVRIGKNTMIAAYNYIIDCDHGMNLGVPMNTQPLKAKPICIGEDVWLGAGCFVLKGVHIEEGAVVGANSVVTKDITSNHIALGSPTKIVKKR
jgi:acetyltransferase-like isoleucine patch superfamily enzyme